MFQKFVTFSLDPISSDFLNLSFTFDFHITLDGNFSNDGPTVLRRGNVPLAVNGIASVQPNPVNNSTKLVVASTE